MLPAAQVGEAELEEIVKIGQAGQSARALMNDEGEGNEASGRLLGEYEGLSHARMARTPRTAPQGKLSCMIHICSIIDPIPAEDNIMAEALNLRNMTQAQTPLLGEENTPMHAPAHGGTGFEGATPRHQVAFTPNPLATPLRANGSDVSATPRAGATPLRTPMRDSLSINPEDGTPRIGDTPREERMRVAAAQRSLKLGFASLPQPSNDFEVVLPEDEEEAEEDERTMTVEDMAERNARMKKLQEEEERKALERRTSVVKRDLPRPVFVNPDQLLQSLRETSEEGMLSGARSLIDSELVDLIQHDTIAHPLPGTPYPGGTPSMYDMPDDEDVAAATLAVHLELSATLGITEASPEELKKGVVLAAGQEEVDGEALSWAHMRETWAYDRNLKAWVDATSLTPEERVAGIAALLVQDRETMTREAAKAAKIEKKLNVTLGGYNVRSAALAKRVKDASAELLKTHIEVESFAKLRATEQVAAPLRVNALKEEVERLERQERDLQSRFQELSIVKEEIQSRIAMKEEQIMMEAEALNEAALAAEEDA